MTADEIRAEAIQRMARAYHERFGIAGEPCDAMPDALRWEALNRAELMADALGDLLPTGVEWAVQFEARESPRMDNASGISTQTMTVRDENHARQAVKNGAPISAMNRRAVSRYVSDWTEVAE